MKPQSGILNTYLRYPEYKGWCSSSFANLSELDRLILKSDILPYIGESSNITCLDIGFGNGIFLQFLAERGINCDGVEIIDVLNTFASEKFPNSTFYNSILDIHAKKKYDYIFMLDVLEHIPLSNLSEFLSCVSSLLDYQGKLILRVPNSVSPFGLLDSFGDLSHLIHFSPRGLKQLSTISPLSCISIDRPSSINLINPRRLKPGFVFFFIFVARFLARQAFEIVFLFIAFRYTRLDISPFLLAEFRNQTS